MPLTPQITLTVNLLDFSGNQLGSIAQPAYLRVQLVNFGNTLPRVSGSGMVAKVVTNPADIPYTGSQISVPLWGNDVITPGPNITYYAISILDANKNVVQAGAYQFTGTGSFDLSAVAQFLPPVIVPAPGIPVLTNPSGTQTIAGNLVIQGTLTVTGAINSGSNYLVVSFSATPVFNAANGVSVFDLTLTGNVTSSTTANLVTGQTVTFIIQQDGTGGRTFVWPTNVKNASPINSAASSISVQSFVVRASGNLYPVGPMTWD